MPSDSPIFGERREGATLLRILCLLNDGLECLRLIHSQIGENLAVNLDTGFVQGTHQLRIGQAFETGSCIDTLNPECAEVTLLVLTITIGIGKTFLPRVLGNCPHIAACAKVTSG